jgi:hypothetical protein
MISRNGEMTIHFSEPMNFRRLKKNKKKLSEIKVVKNSQIIPAI